jgi:ribosomal protein S18 acetylase RimI-like enzyme
MVLIRQFEARDEEAVIAIWSECRLLVPWNDPSSDIRRKVAFGGELFLVAEHLGCIVGAIMGGFDGHRASINYFAVIPARQRQGIGTALLLELERKLASYGAPRVKLMIRRRDSASARFFTAAGFVEDDVLVYGKRLAVDQGRKDG